MHSPFFRARKAIAAPYIKAGSGIRSVAPRKSSTALELVPLPGHTPGHTGYEFSSRGQKVLFWVTSSMRVRVQFQQSRGHPLFDVDQTVAAARGIKLLLTLASEDVLIAGAAREFSWHGRLHREGSRYSWAPWYLPIKLSKPVLHRKSSNAGVSYCSLPCHSHSRVASPSVSIKVGHLKDDQFWTNSVIVEGVHEVMWSMRS